MKTYIKAMGVAGLIGLAVLWAGWAQAAAIDITLTGPADPVEFAEGDDFATTVIGLPWKMSQLRIFPYDVNYEYPTIDANGYWSSAFRYYTIQNIGGFFYPLFRGFSEPTYTNYFSYYDGAIPYGPLNPIDANRYTRLCLRHYLDAGNRTALYLFWQKTVGSEEDNHLGFTDKDVGLGLVPYASGFRLYDIDLTGSSFYSGRITNFNGSLDMGGTWAGSVYGCYVLPSNAGGEGTVSKVDWLRLYDPSASPRLSLTWSTQNFPTNDDRYSIQLFVDTDNTGYDGDLFLTGLRNTGQYEFYTAALPPDDYYFYLRVVHAEESGYPTVTNSAYSARVRILAAPTFEFTSPSYTSGADYAAIELGNPWDMSSALDLDPDLTRMHDIGEYSFANGMFIGRTSGGDSQLALNTYANRTAVAPAVVSGQQISINTLKYRYLTFRMMVQTNVFAIPNRYDRGTVSRWQWARSTFGVDDSYSKDVPLLENWHSYTADLWDESFLETRGSFSSAQAGWRAVQQVNYLIFHCLEATNPTLFYLDDVKLCAMNAPINKAFTIAWQANDADSSVLTATLYYGSLDSGGVYRESADPLAIIPNAHAQQSYVWDTSRVPAGQYYIRAVVSDGSNVLSRVSLVPVVIQNVAPVVGDYDGDGKADQAVYQELSGYWSIRLSSSGATPSVVLGGIGSLPVAGDFDGDGKCDPAVYREATGELNVLLSSTGYLPVSAVLGGAGYQAVAGDFDGDGKADPAVYKAATGQWTVLLSMVGYLPVNVTLGSPGAVPVAGDFDGDGKADPAIYYTATAQWQIMLSSGGYSVVPVQFGVDSCLPVSGDFDGDGVSDPAVYRSASGDWGVMLSGSGYAVIVVHFGGAGYQAVPGDYEGIGRALPAIYDDLSDTWTVM